MEIQVPLVILDLKDRLDHKVLLGLRVPLDHKVISVLKDQGDRRVTLVLVETQVYLVTEVCKESEAILVTLDQSVLKETRVILEDQSSSTTSAKPITVAVMTSVWTRMMAIAACVILGITFYRLRTSLVNWRTCFAG